MKELSIKEKAIAFDKAIERTSKLIDEGCLNRMTGEFIFPELKESEDEDTDEKVRKALIKLVTNHASMDLFIEYDIHLYEALSWLEKQGEQKPADNIESSAQNKPWSEEDSEHLERILKELENQWQRPSNRPYLDEIVSDYYWLKSLKDRVQPKQEYVEQQVKYRKL